MRHLSFPLRLVATLALVGALAAPASAQSSFTLFGAGWGHGVGMSQYGAYGLALEGRSASQILKHYYTGVAVEQREPPKRRYRVGLVQSRTAVTLTSVQGKARIMVGKRRVGVLSGGSRIVRLGKGRYRISGIGRRPKAGTPLRVRLGKGAVVTVGEWGYQLGRGVLELRRASKSSMHVVAILKPEEYLYGLGEVPSSWPKAVLQAQAIAGRTYAHRRVLSPRTGCACQVYADTRDQAYVGWTKEAGTAGGRWVEAVNATASTVVTYGGEPISTLYSSSSGGYTEDVENIWGGSPAPYLKGRCDPGDYVDSNPNRTWKVTLDGATVAAKLRSALGWDVATVTALEDKVRGVSGRVVKMAVKGTRPGGGSFAATASGWTLRGALGLKDTRFWVNADLTVTGQLRAVYDELACAPGLATGAQHKVAGGLVQVFEKGRMYARTGGPAAWVHGRVLDAYLAQGEHAGSLGFPTSTVASAPDGTQSGTFEGGSITCAPGASCVVA